MQLLPYISYSIETDLSPINVEKKLKNNLEENYKWFSMKTDKPFKGGVENSKFHLTRIISYRNSFLPVITGSIEPTENGSKIQILMKLNSFVSAFIILWMVSVFCFGITMIVTMAVKNEYSLEAIVTPFIMLIFAYLLCNIPFRIEAKIAKEKIDQIFRNTY